LGNNAAGNYTLSGAGGSVSITAHALTVTASVQSKTYGQTLTFVGGSTLFTPVGLQYGETIGSVTLAVSGNGGAATAPVGSYTITPSSATGGTFTPANYSIIYNTGSLTVNSLVVSLTGSRSYDGTTVASSGILTVGNAVNGDNVNVASGSGTLASANVGSRAINSLGNLALGNNAAGNYTLSGAGGSVSITAHGLTVTASGQSKTYGQTLTFGGGSTLFTPVGLQYGEIIGSVTLAVSGNGGAVTASVAGSPYTITASAATGGTFTPGNYSITYVNNKLTVNPAALTITASGQSKTYGQTLTLGTTAFTTGTLYNGDTVTGVTLTSLGAAATATVAGSPYTIVPSAATGTGLANYTITYQPGNLTVIPAVLTVTANNLTMGYGQATPALTYNISGFVNGDTISVVSGAPVLSTTGGSTSVVGSYQITITQGSLSAANYSFTMVNGSLTINVAVAITATQPKASEANLAAGMFTVTLEGVTLGTPLAVGYTIADSDLNGNGNDYATLSGTVTIPVNTASATIALTPLAGANTGVGSSTVTLTLSAGANYSVVLANNSATCTLYDDYNDTSGDGLADALAAGFNCSPQTSTSDWETEDTVNDGLPTSYAAMVSNDNAAPTLPTFSMVPQ
jgi:hypothetical protein